MELLTSSAVAPDPTGDEHVVYEARAGRMVVWLVFTLAAVGWCVVPFFVPLGWIGSLVMGVPCVLVSLALLPGIVRSATRRWWIARVRRDELLLRIRSVLNSDLPETDATVVRIPRAAIARVRETRERHTVPGSSAERDRTDVVRALDICLRDVAATGPLAAALAAERTRNGTRRGHFGAYPILLPAPGVMRVAWRTPTMRLAPPLERALEALRAFAYPVATERLETDVDWTRLSEDEIDELVDACVAEGDEIEAMRLLRAARKIDLARAKSEVERRRGGAAV